MPIDTTVLPISKAALADGATVPLAGGRFDYIRYDGTAADQQSALKAHFVELERAIDALLGNGRPKSLALTSLEEAYMWVGKAIRDEQIARSSKVVHDEPLRGE